jgi:hypothetical protein
LDRGQARKLKAPVETISRAFEPGASRTCTRYPREQAAQALKLIASRKAMGKVVLTM